VSSATAIRNQGLQSPFRLCGPVVSNQTKNLEFGSFVNDTECAIERFTKFLETNRDVTCPSERPDIAILSEAGTTYGAVPPSEDCYARFVYPREIASLRNAYPRSASGATSNPAGKTPDIVISPFLAFDISDRTNNADEPPDFSSQQGPLSKEAVLMEFA